MCEGQKNVSNPIPSVRMVETVVVVIRKGRRYRGKNIDKIVEAPHLSVAWVGCEGAEGLPNFQSMQGRPE